VGDRGQTGSFRFRWNANETFVIGIEESVELVGAGGIELKATLKTRKLLIPLNVKNAKNTEVAQMRYTPGTRQGEPSTTRSMPQQMCEKLWTLSRTRRGLC